MSKKSPKIIYRFILFIAKRLLRLFFRVEVRGLDNLARGGGMIASNHVSYLDPPLIATSVLEEVHFIAKASLFKPTLFKWLIESLNTHPIKGSVKDVQTFREVTAVIEGGYKVVLFPEGTRGKTNDIAPLKRGIASIFIKAKCPIYPVYLHGTHAAWKKGQKIPNFGTKLICQFGKPIQWEEFSHIDIDQVEEEVLKHLLHALQSLKALCEQDMASSSSP